MKVSYDWLQSYFTEPLPEPEALAEQLTFHAFEIDGIDVVDGDTVIDIDVLSNRSSDCLSHRGIASEIATILDRRREFSQHDPLGRLLTDVPSTDGHAEVALGSSVQRFSTAVLDTVTVGPSPAWLQRRLQTLGQRPINNVVDATNYVMLLIGQPLHAFDADKLTGTGPYLLVRPALAEENITVLTGETYTLDESMLVIADAGNDTPVAIAGVKGGVQAEVSQSTVRVVLEAANFDYVSVRKTSQKLKLQTDASVRFQNQPVPELTMYALQLVIELLQDSAGATVVSRSDWYPKPRTVEPVTCSFEQIKQTLGISLQATEIREIISRRLGWDFEEQQDTVTVVPAWERTDVAIAEDVIEEIGRIHGYRTLPSHTLPTLPNPVLAHPRWVALHEIRTALYALGFSEMLTYQLRSQGELELANALASDKNFVRSSLSPGLSEALKKNTYYAPLLGIDTVRIFEIGTVWHEGIEQLELGIGVAFTKKQKGTTPESVAQEALEQLRTSVSASFADVVLTPGVVTATIDYSVVPIQSVATYEQPAPALGMVYQTPSVYPFVLRDIALWVPETVSEEVVIEYIRSQAGDNLVRIDCFDRFAKDGRVSYAYHLVFQAFDRTLSDVEITTSMQQIEARLADEQGWEVR